MNQPILVIDDEADVRESLADLLEANGFVPLLADSVNAAQLVLHTTPVDLVISDVNMPEENGTVLRDMMRERPELEQIPFILMTGFMPTTLPSVSAPILFKPFNSNEMLNMIHDALRCSRRDILH